MPAPKSQITVLYEGLKKAPELAGIPFYNTARKMARNGAPGRIVMYPTGGTINNPLDKSKYNRDVDRAIVVHIWGKDFDEVCYLQTLFVQALVNQGAGGEPVSAPGATAGIYWTAVEEEWDYSEDSDRQGEELYMRITALNSLEKVAKGVGSVSSIVYNALTATLSADMGTTDTVANVASTLGFPITGGLLTIDSEQMTYTTVTGSSFIGLIRGVNGTTAATHSNGATVNVS